MGTARLRLGIAGGGQLGRMLALAAAPLGIEVTVLDPEPGCPAAQVGAAQVVGGLGDRGALATLAAGVDVVTWEVEHIDAAALVDIEASGAVVRPSPWMLSWVQDKLEQKRRLAAAGLPVADFAPLGPAGTDLGAAALGAPVVVKARRGGYDGRGVSVVDDPAAAGGDGSTSYAERVVDFDAELAVLVARDVHGEVATFPLLRTFQRDGICHRVVTPTGLPRHVEAEAADVARRTVALLDGPGVYAIEMFVVGATVLVNEIAPRVHNSGHLTVEACATSQFEQHVRAVGGLPLGSTALRRPAAAMVNVLGRTDGELTTGGLDAALAFPDVHVHLYGKQPRPGRKIGHVTALGDDPAESLDRADEARGRLVV